MTGVEPMAHALPVNNVLGSDIAEPGLSLEQVLQNAPETDGPFFKVPKVIHVVREIPRTPTGKVQRNRIAAQLRGQGP